MAAIVHEAADQNPDPLYKIDTNRRRGLCARNVRWSGFRMSFLAFLADGLAMVILVLTSLRNDRRKPGEKMVGIFEYKETLDRPRPERRLPDYLKQRQR
jgi:hypothetical protein